MTTTPHRLSFIEHICMHCREVYNESWWPWTGRAVDETTGICDDCDVIHHGGGEG